MRLTKLELSGFKSFARKTELDFGRGITAVIGPNGSGKSNISDAIRWVLGEQSARALRGSKMEDVIFSGTEQRKSQGYCEVTLTFDNADGKLRLPFEEIAVTRRLYRSGESEYCLNKNLCRLRDVQELFRDTGIGKDGYSIISQGRVDEILSNKSNERRAALEEAAGVMRYRVRKEEAARKLDHTEKNLERIEDILDELAARLGPLEEQSAEARAYLKLRDELKDLEVNQFLYQYDKSHERLAAMQASIEQAGEEAAASNLRAETIQTECHTLEQRASALDAALNEQQSRLLTMLSGVEAHTGECKVLLERKEHIEREIERLHTERETAETRERELCETLTGMERNDAGRAAAEQLERDIAAADADLAARDAELAKAEEMLEAMKTSIMDAMNRLADARGDLSRFETMAQAIGARRQAIEAEIETAGDAAGTLAEEYEAALAEHAERQAAADRTRAAMEEAQRNREARREAQQNAQQALHTLEQETGAAESRLRVLNEMARSHEGYYASVKSILRDAARDARLGSAIIGVVAELIRVPKEYETALTMAMGSSLQNIVTPTAEDAKSVIEYLRSHDYGRATLLPVALLRERPLNAQERRFLDADGCIGVASELVRYDPAVRTVVEYLLGRTVVVRDLQSGIALKKRSGGAFSIATLAGDLISTGGSMSGGSVKKREFSLLGREREIAELTESLKAKRVELKELTEREETLRKDILMAELQTDAFREELHADEIELAKSAEKLDIIRRDMESGDEKRARLIEERDTLDENLRDLEKEREAALAVQTELESGNAATQDDVKRAQQALQQQRAARETASQSLTAQKVRRMALQKEQDAAENEKRRLTAECGRLSEHIKASAAAETAQRAELDSVERRLAEMQRSVAGEQQQAGEEKKRQQDMEDERDTLSETLRERREQRERLLAAEREQSERKHKLELQREKAETELAAMQDRIWEAYELTYENALPFRHEIAVAATASRIASIRAELRGMGDVNLSAIEDFKAVTERHDALAAQRDDLRKAQTDLSLLIDELTATMEKTFSTQFAVIQKNFGEVFTELFGGGHAELRLADQDDVLGCDIDIIAQPPGKKLQLLSLLSGGERALTAIALLFAMLRLKPPAFCVLDEIESSLDEANVSRFAGYLKAYSDETQFIIITHRKGSMEVCDALYGVSMEEKGVSKVVSARFGEAVS